MLISISQHEIKIDFFFFLGRFLLHFSPVGVILNCSSIWNNMVPSVVIVLFIHYYSKFIFFMYFFNTFLFY